MFEIEFPFRVLLTCNLLIKVYFNYLNFTVLYIYWRIGNASVDFKNRLCNRNLSGDSKSFFLLISKSIQW